MTDPSPFFRLIWRANAVLILGAALLVVASLSYRLLSDLRRDRSPAASSTTAIVPTTASGPERLYIGNFVRAGGAVFQASLHGSGSDTYAVSSKRDGVVRNILFFDSEKGTTRRLFANDLGVVVNQRVIRRAETTDREQPVARVFVYIAADSSGNGRLGPEDRQRIVITRADGSNPIVLAEDIDGFETEATVGAADPIGYFLRRDTDLRYYEIDQSTFAPKRDLPISMPRTGG